MASGRQPPSAEGDEAAEGGAGPPWTESTPEAKDLNRPRTSRLRFWVGVGLAASLGGVLGWAVWLVMRLDQVEDAARTAVAEADQARAEAMGRAALEALRAQDSRRALEFAHQAMSEPIARGVALLAQEAGAPGRRWGTKPEAGCSSLAVVDELIACGTLGGVALYRVDDGQSAGRLDTGPRGWQHAVAALPAHRLAAGGDDRHLRIFDVATRAQVGEAVAFDEGITALASDGEALWLGLRNGEVRTVDGPALHRHPGLVLSVVASHQVVVSLSAQSMQLSRPDGLSVLDQRAGAAAFKGDGLVVGVERTVALIDARGSGMRWGGHHADVTALAVAEDGRVVSASADGELRWWSERGEPEGKSELYEEKIRVLSFAGDALLVVAGGRLDAWELPSARVPAWDEPPTALAVLGRDGQVVAGFSDGSVRRVPVAGGPREALELRHRGPVRVLAEAPGEPGPAHRRLLSGGADGRVLAQRWNGEVETLAEEHAPIVALSVSMDGKRAAWVTEDGWRVLHSLEFDKEIHRAQAAPARAVAFSSDGRRWATGGEDKRVSLFDAESGSGVGSSTPLDAAVTALAWSSADGVVVGCADGRVFEWSATQGRETRSWRGGRDAVTALSVGKEVMLGGTAGGEVRLWALDEPLPKVLVPADAGEVKAVALLEDRLVFAGTDRLVHRLERP
jgi:WD40 repeat protein